MAKIFKQKMTYFFLGLSILSIAAALIIGIDDNPPGLILSLLSSILFILAFTHNWKRVKDFIMLAIFSLVSFFIAAILHNVFDAIGGEGTFLGSIGVLFFLVAIFICPAGLLVGIVGSIVKSFKKSRDDEN